MVVAVDARRRRTEHRDGEPAGRCSPTGDGRPPGSTPCEWAERCATIGAGEILLTSMDRDGTRDGFDLELTRRVSRRSARSR